MDIVLSIGFDSIIIISSSDSGSGSICGLWNCDADSII